MDRQQRFWKMVVAFSRIGVIAAAGLLMYRFRDEKILLALNLFGGLTGLAGLLWVLRTGNVYKFTRRLAVADHAIVVASLAFKAYYPGMPMFYMVVAWAHLFTNVQVLGFDRFLNRFIQISMIVASPIVILNLYPNLFQIVLFMFFVLLTLFVSMDVAQRRAVHESEEKTARELRQIENSLLRHDFGNLLTGVLLTSNNTAVAKRVVDNISQRLMEFLESLEGEKVEIGVQNILERAGRLCKERSETEIVKRIETPYVVNVRTGVLASALGNVISNACEANAKTVTITVGARKIVVSDDGSGFDVGKIRLGYTTKPSGHGQGLWHSIEGCRHENIPVSIRSQAGQGTQVTFDLGQVIVAEEA